jgi:hypothetical protein
MSAIIVGFCDDVAYGAYRNKKDNQRKQEAWDAMIQERRVVKARREEERLLEERVIVRPTAQQLLQWGRRVGLK